MKKLIMGCTVAALTMLSSPSEGIPGSINSLSWPSIVESRQFGIASWYGVEFQGLETASGPPFDMNAMTCAHRDLPLGTLIRVTDLVNLRSVILKINDRGPYVGNRVLDVSRAAAKRLGFLGAGLAPVRIDVVRLPRHCITIRPGPALVASVTKPSKP
ncbi:MAG: septal ring lytic transglycosylase RlpA family protein [Acidobacteria bacterium]|nr:MAG: septal ring lytic transglycosylase RlpA family protein [Acidobacteriota bacterium]